MQSYELANELWLDIIEKCNKMDLLKCRLLSKDFKSMSDARLYKIFLLEFNETKILLDKKMDVLNEEINDTLGRMTYNKSFLRRLLPRDIDDLIWFNNYMSIVPHELKVIMKCLCILYNGNGDVKKTIRTSKFKRWLLSLSDNVNDISLENINRVVKIIRNDITITYERLREVSLTGYNLLIIIAACLNYCSVYDGIKSKKIEIMELDNILRIDIIFMNKLSYKKDILTLNIDIYECL